MRLEMGSFSIFLATTSVMTNVEQFNIGAATCLLLLLLLLQAAAGSAQFLNLIAIGTSAIGAARVSARLTATRGRARLDVILLLFIITRCCCWIVVVGRCRR